MYLEPKRLAVAPILIEGVEHAYCNIPQHWEGGAGGWGGYGEACHWEGGRNMVVVKNGL